MKVGDDFEAGSYFVGIDDQSSRDLDIGGRNELDVNLGSLG